MEPIPLAVNLWTFRLHLLEFEYSVDPEKNYEFIVFQIRLHDIRSHQYFRSAKPMF